MSRGWHVLVALLLLAAAASAQPVEILSNFTQLARNGTKFIETNVVNLKCDSTAYGTNTTFLAFDSLGQTRTIKVYCGTPEWYFNKELIDYVPVSKKLALYRIRTEYTGVIANDTVWDVSGTPGALSKSGVTKRHPWLAKHPDKIHKLGTHDLKKRNKWSQGDQNILMSFCNWCGVLPAFMGVGSDGPDLTPIYNALDSLSGNVTNLANNFASLANLTAENDKAQNLVNANNFKVVQALNDSLYDLTDTLRAEITSNYDRQETMINNIASGLRADQEILTERIDIAYNQTLTNAAAIQNLTGQLGDAVKQTNSALGNLAANVSIALEEVNENIRLMTEGSLRIFRLIRGQILNLQNGVSQYITRANVVSVWSRLFELDGVDGLHMFLSDKGRGRNESATAVALVDVYKNNYVYRNGGSNVHVSDMWALYCKKRYLLYNNFGMLTPTSIADTAGPSGCDPLEGTCNCWFEYTREQCNLKTSVDVTNPAFMAQASLTDDYCNTYINPTVDDSVTITTSDDFVASVYRSCEDVPYNNTGFRTLSFLLKWYTNSPKANNTCTRTLTQMQQSPNQLVDGYVGQLVNTMALTIPMQKQRLFNSLAADLYGVVSANLTLDRHYFTTETGYGDDLEMAVLMTRLDDWVAKYRLYLQRRSVEMKVYVDDVPYDVSQADMTDPVVPLAVDSLRWVFDSIGPNRTVFDVPNSLVAGEPQLALPSTVDGIRCGENPAGFGSLDEAGCGFNAWSAENGDAQFDAIAHSLSLEMFAATTDANGFCESGRSAATGSLCDTLAYYKARVANNGQVVLAARAGSYTGTIKFPSGQVFQEFTYGCPTVTWQRLNSSILLVTLVNPKAGIQNVVLVRGGADCEETTNVQLQPQQTLTLTYRSCTPSDDPLGSLLLVSAVFGDGSVEYCGGAINTTLSVQEFVDNRGVDGVILDTLSINAQDNSFANSQQLLMFMERQLSALSIVIYQAQLSQGLPVDNVTLSYLDAFREGLEADVNKTQEGMENNRNKNLTDWEKLRLETLANLTRARNETNAAVSAIYSKLDNVSSLLRDLNLSIEAKQQLSVLLETQLNKTTDAFFAVSNSTKEAVVALKDTFTALNAVIESLGSGTGAGFGGAFGAIGSFIADAAIDTAQTVERGGNLVGKGFVAMGKGIEDVATTAFNFIKDTIDKVKGLLDDVLGFFSSIVGIIIMVVVAVIVLVGGGALFKLYKKQKEAREAANTSTEGTVAKTTSSSRKGDLSVVEAQRLWEAMRRQGVQLAPFDPSILRPPELSNRWRSYERVPDADEFDF